MSEPLRTLQSAVREHIGRFAGYDFDRDHEDLRSALAASERPPVDPLREAERDCAGGPRLLGVCGCLCHQVAASPAAPRPEGLSPRAAYDQGFHHGIEVGRSDERENIKAEGLTRLEVAEVAEALEGRNITFVNRVLARLSDTGDTPDGES